MKIQPNTHKSLAETVAGKLAASLLDGSLLPGMQLPAERDLMAQLGQTGGHDEADVAAADDRDVRAHGWITYPLRG